MGVVRDTREGVSRSGVPQRRRRKMAGQTASSRAAASLRRRSAALLGEPARMLLASVALQLLVASVLSPAVAAVYAVELRRYYDAGGSDVSSSGVVGVWLLQAAVMLIGASSCEPVQILLHKR